MTRREVLSSAERAVMSDRNKDYGSPEDNFQDIAEFWNQYLQGKFPIQAHDVAVMMILVKIARLRTSPSKADHWIDIAGYSSCGSETANAE